MAITRSPAGGDRRQTVASAFENFKPQLVLEQLDLLADARLIRFQHARSDRDAEPRFLDLAHVAQLL